MKITEYDILAESLASKTFQAYDIVAALKHNDYFSLLELLLAEKDDKLIIKIILEWIKKGLPEEFLKDV